MKEIIEAISTVGFPIICCLGLAYYVNKQLEKFRTTVENNTKAIIELLTFLRKGGEK